MSASNKPSSSKKSKNLLSLSEAAKTLGVSVDTIRRWEKKGKLQGTRTQGGHRRFEKESLDRLLVKRHKHSSNYTNTPSSSSASTTTSVAPTPPVFFAVPGTSYVPLSPLKTEDIQEINFTPLPAPLSSLPDNKRQWQVSRRFLTPAFLLGGLLLLLSSVKGLSGTLAYQTLFFTVSENLPPVASLLPSPSGMIASSVSRSGRVLQATDTIEGLIFQINVPTNIGNSLTVTGDLTVGGDLVTTGEVVFDSITADTADITTLSLGGTTITATGTEINYLDGLTLAAGGVVYSTSSGLQITTVGTTNQVLVSNGSSAPSWKNVSAIQSTDASTLDGLDSTAFLRSNASDTFESGNTLTIAGTLDVDGSSTFDGAVDINGGLSIADTDITFDGASTTFTTTGDLTLALGGGDLATAARVTIGSTTPGTAQLFVDGNSDVIQLLVQGNATQTSNLFVLEQSDGTDVFSVGNTGTTTLTDSGAGNINFNLSGTGDFTISDSGTPFVTFNSNGDVVLADGTLLDLSGIIHDDAAAQGLKLPQTGSFTAISGGGEGYLAWNTTTNTLMTFDGTSWAAVAGGSLFTDGGTTTYLTSTTDDFALGGSTSEAAFFVDVSASALHLNPFGAGSGNTGEIRFEELEAGGDNYTGFKAPDSLAGNVIYTLPAADATTSNQVLASSGAGALSWIDVSAGAGSLWTDGGTTTYLTSQTDDLAVGGTTSESNLFFDESASALHLNPFNTATGNTGEIRFEELEAGGDNYTGFKAPDALAGNLIYTLPTADGGSNQVLATSGTGTLSWIDLASGAGGVWTRSSTNVYVTTTTDEVIIGGSTPLSSAKLSLDGDSDQIQLIVQGHSTQTTDLAVFEQSSGTDVFNLSNAGNLTLAGNFILTGVLDINGGGTHDIAGTLNLSGNTLTSSGDLSLDPAGGDVVVDGNLLLNDTFTLQVGGKTAITYNAFANAADAPEEASISTDNDLYIGGDLEVDGTIFGTLSGAGVGGFTAGSVIFANTDGTLTQDNAQFFWDNTDNKLGLGTNAPTSKLHVTGAVVGKALAIFDETGDQNILVASASGVTQATIGRTGNLSINGVFTGLSTSVTTRLQATGTTSSSTGNASIFFLDSSGAVRGRYDTADLRSYFGDGSDGAASFSGSTNINTASGIGDSDDNSTFADGIAFRVNAPSDAATSLTRYNGSSTLSNGLVAGDEILLINMQGTSSDNADVGNYEFIKVSSVTADTITLAKAIDKSYNGTTAADQIVMVQRIPQWTTVTLDSTDALTGGDWDGATAAGDATYRTGIVAFRATGTVTIGSSASISATGLGFRGGSGGPDGGASGGVNGESYDGIVGAGGGDAAAGTSGGGSGEGSTTNTVSGTRGGGGGGGTADATGVQDGGGGGGGGGYGEGGGGGGGGGTDAAAGGAGGTSNGIADVWAGGGGGGNDNGGGGSGGDSGANATGANGGTTATCFACTGTGGGSETTTNGEGAGGGGGGGLSGDHQLSKLFVGSGGGGGGGQDANNQVGGAGGDGGGILFVAANQIISHGTILSSGNSGTVVSNAGGHGGGGSGGSIAILGNSVHVILDAAATNAVTATGGAVNSSAAAGGEGGGGGVGRIRIEAPTIINEADSATAVVAPQPSTDQSISTHFLSALGTYGTLHAGAVDLENADLAEYYLANDSSLEAGDVVSVEPSTIEVVGEDGSISYVEGKGGLSKSSREYDQTVLGIVSTTPGITLGSRDQEGNEDSRAVALSGRVPLKIATDSAQIKVGDFLTTSSTPGRAMKAKKAGYVVAKALENWQPCTEEIVSDCGGDSILAFVSLGYHDPYGGLTTLSNFSFTPSPSPLLDLDSPSASDSGLLATSSASLSSSPLRLRFQIADIDTQEIVNNLAVFSEAKIADLEAGTIKTLSLETTDLYLGELSLSDYLDQYLSLYLNPTSEPATATPSAVLSSIDSTPSATPTDLPASLAFELLSPHLSLTDSVLTFLSEIVFKGKIRFEDATTFLAKAIFKGNVEFSKAPVYITKDIAGRASLSAGNSQVDVIFDTPYQQPPIVTISLVTQEALDIADLSIGRQAVVTNVRPEGFTIVLPSPAPRSYTFNWIAIAVEDAKNSLDSFTSPLLPTPTPQPIIETSPVPTPTPTITSEPTPSLSETPDSTPSGQLE